MPRRTKHKTILELLRGQSLIEVVVAIGLLAVIASSFFVFVWSQMMFTSGNGESIETVAVAQEGLDAVRAIRDLGWSNVTTGTHGIAPSANGWSFQGTSDTSTGYTRTVTVTDVAPNVRQVVVTVAWVDASKKTQTTTLTTILTNWQNEVAVSTSTLSGDWAHPVTLATLDIGLNTIGTGVAARNKLAYMTGTGSSDGKDFYVIDATSTTHPVKVASIDTGPGLNAVAINGNYAYVANNYSSNQLQIINISATTSPYMIGTGKTLTGNTHAALSVAVTGTIALVGTATDNGKEFTIVDVTDPAIPVIKGQLEIGGNVNRISILGDRAFLATSNSSKEFMVINISNPNAPVITKTIDISGSNAAKGIYVNPQDKRAYVVRAQANSTSPEVNIYNVTAPDAPVLITSKEISGNVYAAAAADNLLFIGTDVTNLGIQIFNIASLPTLTLYSSLNPLIVNDIAFANNIFYGSLQGVVEELVLFTSK